jgi:hypothetical protein
MSRRLVLSYLGITVFVLLVLEIPLGITFARRAEENLFADPAASVARCASCGPRPRGSRMATCGPGSTRTAARQRCASWQLRSTR